MSAGPSPTSSHPTSSLPASLSLPASHPAPGLSARLASAIGRLAPGVLLCLGVSGAAYAAQEVEVALFGRAWLEALVLAIVLGTAVRTAWAPPRHWQAGVTFCAHTLLEVAVVLLGASLSLTAIRAAGAGLILGIAAVVAFAILLSYAIGRTFGLSRRMAILVACGNSICGNSAIAAVAPIIDADGGDVAAAIAFTAVLGVVVVLGLPLAVPLLHLSVLQYGTLAGLTVYAVPQVLAATAPVAALAVQMGTLVKLVRVLMLGPVTLVLSLLAPALQEGSAHNKTKHAAAKRPTLRHLVPWFIIGFLLMAVVRTLGLLPTAVLPHMANAAGLLTVVSMAGLGLGVDVRAVTKAGPRVTAVVVLSLLALGAVSLTLIHALGIV